MAFSPDGKQLAALVDDVGVGPAEKGALIWWNFLGKGGHSSHIGGLGAPLGPPAFLGFTAGGTVQVLSDGNVLGWDGQPGHRPRVLWSHVLPAKAYAPAALLVPGADALVVPQSRGIMVVNLRTRHTFDALAGFQQPEVAAAGNGTIIVAGTDGSVAFWDLDSADRRRSQCRRSAAAREGWRSTLAPIWCSPAKATGRDLRRARTALGSPWSYSEPERWWSAG